MARQFDRSALPPLSKAFRPRALVSDENGQARAVREVRRLAESLRREGSLPFYSMRALATALGVSLRTMALAFEQLEREGLLVRLRGSHTRLMGTAARPLRPVAGVVGMPVWLYGLRHFMYRRTFAHGLGDTLWPHALTVDTILYWENEDRSPDFADRLLRHHMDMAVWFQPQRHNQDAIGFLKDHGVPCLIISDRENPCGLPARIEIDWEPAYGQVLRDWKTRRGVRRVILVEGDPETAPRLRFFDSIARRHGLACERRKSSHKLAGELAGDTGLGPDTAIALFDDYASTQFPLRDPNAFLHLVDRHRLLFAREFPSLPFVGPKRFNCDCLLYPMDAIVRTAADMLLAWRSGLDKPGVVTITGEVRMNVDNPAWT